MITDIESDPRHAGQIQRYHTWPTIRKQSVGEHTWQAMRIMMTIDVGMCTTRLMHYAMLHDVGEMAGDLPFPSKRNSPQLAAGMEMAESMVRENMMTRWGQPALPALSDTERTFFKMCENLEMWEFGLQERNLGNRYGTIVAHRMLIAAMEQMEKLSPDLQSRTKDYVRRRTEQEMETEFQRIGVDEDAVITVDKREKQA